MHITKEDLTLAANTIRGLSMDAIEKAASGHPGMPLGCADIAAVLWLKIMNYNPNDVAWPNRDRFVLSAGHGSALLYSMLHLAGFGLTLDDLKNFRQWKSLTPGHPEFGHTIGVETTTGPLGQGFANGVGMAMASKMLAENFGNELINHYIYAIVGDGDIMEGISYEAASLAGHWNLGNLIYIYDSNNISIEGDTDITLSDDAAKRFESCNWHVQKIDGHDTDAIERAVLAAQNVKDKPSIIIARTKIAKGSPGKEGSEASHGSPLGKDEIIATKKNLGLPENENFYVSEKVYSLFKERSEELKAVNAAWKEQFNKTITSEQKVLWDKFFAPVDAASLRNCMPDWSETKKIATRSAGGKVLEVLFKEVPNLIGGSADLSPSTKTFVKGYSATGHGKLGRNIHFGIREHAMGAIQNGIMYYGGFNSYSSTFFVFMDYMRPAVRVAALSGLRSIYVFTHDSFFVGEDGPTHEPVEHLAAARVIPNLNVIRPADAIETAEAWISALSRTDGPTALCLSRQDLPIMERQNVSAAAFHKGAYIIHECVGAPDIIMLASGSEVHVSVEAAALLAAAGIKARVVSFPSWFLFDKQDESYRSSILVKGARFAVVEAGRAFGWERYTGRDALFITLETFGASAPAEILAEQFGFTSEKIAESVKKFLGK